MMKRRLDGSVMAKGTRTALVLMLCAASVAGMEGCKKKAPPPPPPPAPAPPPPPPPPPVSFDTLSQSLGADARVQFAPSLSLENEDVAKAVIELASALAKGDTGALEGLVAKSKRDVVEKVKELGGLSGNAEAVRVVYVGKNDDSTGFKVTTDAVSRLFTTEGLEEANRKLTPEIAVQIAALLRTATVNDNPFDATALVPPLNEEKVQKIKDAWERVRSDAANAAIADQIALLLQNSTSVPGLKDAEYMTLIAVQTPDGVDLTGWGLEKAFGKWTFTPASTDGRQKKSASEWDGIGPAGFSMDSRIGIASAAPVKKEGEGTEGTTGTDKPAEEKKDEPGEQEQPGKEKRTPNGPVKIPGGG